MRRIDTILTWRRWTGNDVARYDTAIVGHGPLGAVLAASPGGRGRQAVVVDRQSGAFALPRAAHIDRTGGPCVLQEIGCPDNLLSPPPARNPARLVSAPLCQENSR